MPGVLVDTDVAIDYLRGEIYARPLLDFLWQQGGAVLSVLGVYELTAGMRENERGPTLAFMNACAIEGLTMEIAIKGGENYRKYRSSGITLTSLDCLIAATAEVRGYKIATRNVKHYPDKNLLLDIAGYVNSFARI